MGDSLTIESAIKHAEEVAEEKEKDARFYTFSRPDNYRKESSEKCAAKHRQLAEWLKDYKRLLAIESGVDIRCGNCKHDDEGSSLCDECLDDVRRPKWEAVE